MRFATSFNVFLALSLSFLIAWNIVGMVYFAPRYFRDYIEDVKTKFPGDEYALINTFIASKDFDPATIEEYRLTLEDLKSLTESLEAYIPKKETSVWTFESLQKIGFAPDLIREVLFLNSVESFLSNITSIVLSDQETPEKRFLLRLLATVVYMNVVYIGVILLVTFVWTRLTFKQIKSLTDRIHQITERRDYTLVQYGRTDEFAPLVDAINILSKNLSYQWKIRSDFLSDFSHEIKTPITALKILFEGVEDGIIPLNPKTLETVHYEIERILSTTNAILEYEKVVAGANKPIHREMFDFLKLAREISHEYQVLFAQNTQSVVFDEKETFEVYLEKEGITRILHNVFSNFSKYAGPKTVLSIRSYRRSGMIHIVFSDNGTGISKDQIPFVHEKFYQADTARSGDVKRGIGIGLSIIDKIVELHEGILSVTSDIGKGFHLKISLKESSSQNIHLPNLHDKKNSV